MVRADDLRRAVRDPDAYSGNGSGPTPEPSPRATPLEKLRARLIVGDAITSLPRPEPLIEGILDLDSLAVLYGKAGSGKTFLALSWALSVGSGAWWCGRKVEQGPVLYVVAEGVAGVGMRVEAWRDLERIENIGALSWLNGAVPLFQDRGYAKALAQLAAELHPRLLVVDTVARCMPGADENSAQHMGQVVEALDLLRQGTHATVLGVHHAGKERSAGMRGSSALLGAVDTVLELEGGERRLTLRPEKVKNGPDDWKLGLRLTRQGDSCVITEDRGSDGSDGELVQSAVDTLGVLQRIEIPDGISTTTWLAASGKSPSTFYEHLKKLLEQGLVKNLGTPHRTRYVSTPTPTNTPTGLQ